MLEGMRGAERGGGAWEEIDGEVGGTERSRRVSQDPQGLLGGEEERRGVERVEEGEGSDRRGGGQNAVSPAELEFRKRHTCVGAQIGLLPRPRSDLRQLGHPETTNKEEVSESKWIFGTPEEVRRKRNNQNAAASSNRRARAARGFPFWRLALLRWNRLEMS